VRVCKGSVLGTIPEDTPMRKCAGVKTFKSSGSKVSGQNGCEVRHASISASAVLNSSNVNICV
jgi:hypothetical protein